MNKTIERVERQPIVTKYKSKLRYFMEMTVDNKVRLYFMIERNEEIIMILQHDFYYNTQDDYIHGCFKEKKITLTNDDCLKLANMIKRFYKEMIK